MASVVTVTTSVPDIDPPITAVPHADYFLHKRHSASTAANHTHNAHLNHAFSVSHDDGDDDDSSSSTGSSSCGTPPNSDLDITRIHADILPATNGHQQPHNKTNGTAITIAEQNTNRNNTGEILRASIRLSRPQRIARSLARHWGSWFSAMSSFFFSWQAVGMKKVSSIEPYELVIFQSGMQAIPSAFILLIKRKNPVSLAIIKKSGWKLVLRGVLGGSASLLRIFAFRYVAMGEVSTLLFASPVFVAILSPFLLRERPSRITLMAVLLTITGLVLVVQPEFMFGSHAKSAAHAVSGNVTVAERNLGLGCAVGAAGVAVGIQLTLRLLRDESEHVVMFWYGCVACTGAVIATAIFDTFKRPGSDLWLILLTGGFQYMSQLFQTLAFQMGDSATAVSIVRTTEILWAYMWQISIFSEPVNQLSLGGAVIVLSSILLVIYEKYRHVRNEERREKKERAKHDAVSTISQAGVVNFDGVTLPATLCAASLSSSTVGKVEP